MENIIEQDIGAWINSAESDENREFREAIHTILSAISNDAELKANMVLKGGILMAVRYQSHRYTKDIDLSTERKLEDLSLESVSKTLSASLAYTVEKLGYDLDCNVQSCKLTPPADKNPTYPCINLSVGYAYKGTPKHKRLLAGKSPTTISIDYSLNEFIPNIEKFSFSENDEILIYSLADLIAEKIRSILQQALRNRSRRQDIFDLHLILTSDMHIDGAEKDRILKSLVEKSESRGFTPSPDSLDNPEIRKRSEKDYRTLQDDITGELPDFNEAYDMVIEFYKSLPWS